jgi:bifunctional non-homologous end joining protein LigD
MDPPADPSWEPVPARVEPMFPVKRSRLPARAGAEWAIEFGWGGLRAAAYVDGGILRLASVDEDSITARFPEVRPLGPELGSRAAVLDGELITLGADRRPDLARLGRRAEAESESVIRRLRRDEPAVFVLYDLLHLDGRPTADLPYSSRRALLEDLGLNGPAWQTAPSFPAGEATAVRAAARTQGLPSIVAKRASSPYRPGRHPDWLAVPV